MRPARDAAIAAALAALTLLAACGGKTPPEREPGAPPSGVPAEPPLPTDNAAEQPAPPPGENAEAPKIADFASGRAVRVALHTSTPRVTISGTGPWRLYDSDGASLLVKGDAGDAWTIEADHGKLRAVRTANDRTARRDAPFVARPARSGALVTVNGRSYRGEIAVRIGKDGLVVVNRLSLEDYLRGVVPLEIGRRGPEERAAVEAQAIAARSYALAHLRTDAARTYDLLSTVSDQVYGGVEAETPLSDAAIASTRSLVITWQGRVIAAPYSANCGGRTADADEVWHQGTSAYLQSVSDRINRSGDRFYCDIAPHFRWTRTFTKKELSAALEKNLRAYVPVNGEIGAVTDLRIDHRTPSGRVGTLVLVTDRGEYSLRSNEIRFVLRAPGSEILPSTMFSLDMERDGDGRVTVLTVTGSGNGHGVGMCQWGAIGRARAGQNARTILATYYPGTVVTALSQ
jgi:stage II sporulation protein D